MKRRTTLLLRAAVVLIGISAVAFLLWEPHIEGRNANATLLAIYFKDPFLAFVYAGSIPFFVGLYQAFRVLEYVSRNTTFSPSARRSVRTIKRCAIALIGLVALGEISIILGESDDRAGGIFLGVLIAVASVVVATAMGFHERALQNARRVKPEADPSE